MSLHVTCAGCGVSFVAKSEWVGKKTKCPKCGSAITIGAATRSPPPYAQPQSSGAPPGWEHSPYNSAAPVAAARQRRAGVPMVAKVGIGAVAGAALLGLGYFLALRSLDQRPPTAAAAPAVATDETSAQIAAVAPAPPPKSVAHVDAPGDGAAPALVFQAGSEADGLRSAFAAAEQIDWQPTSPENIAKIEAAIAATSTGKLKNVSPQELEALQAKLQTKPWNYDDHVWKLNAHTIESLAAGGRSVMLFARVVDVSPSSPRRFIAEVIGRGYETEMFLQRTPATPLNVGDEVLVFGTQMTKHPQLELHSIAATFVARGDWPEPTNTPVLQPVADYLRFTTRIERAQEAIASNLEKFQEIQPNPESLTDRVRYAFTLNATGQQFDAIRMPGSANNPGDDLALMFVAPPESVVDWGITSVDGSISRGFAQSFELENYAPQGAKWPADHVCRFQVLQGSSLRGSKSHALWFRFKDDAPVPMHVCAVYLKSGTLSPGHVSLMQQLAYDPVEPTTTRDLTQISLNDAAQFALARGAGPGGPMIGRPPFSSSSSGPPSGAAMPGAAMPGGPRPGGPGPNAMTNPNGVNRPIGSVASINAPGGGAATNTPSTSTEGKIELARAELPGFRPEDIAGSVVVAPLPRADDAKLELINPDEPFYSAIAGFELDPAGDAKHGWSVQSFNKKGDKKPVGKLFVESGALKFRWASGMTRIDGGALRNCVLRISGGGQDKVVVLRGLTKLDPLVVDFKKDLERIALGEDLPAESGIRLVLDAIDQVPTETTITDDEVKFRTATFVVLKPAESNLPGVRLRLVLWKTGLKNEVIMRAELTPVTSPQNLRMLKATAAKTKAGAQEGNSDEDDVTDPTASSNSRYLTFSIKGLGLAKNIITNQLQGVRNQISIDSGLILTKESQLRNMSGLIVGTAAEIDAIRTRINILRNEISALENEVAMLNAVVPKLQGQLEAFPPLEKFGNSLHLKSTIGLRVVYKAGEYEVPLLQAGNGP